MDIASFALQAQAGDLGAFDQLIKLLVGPMTSRIYRSYSWAGWDLAEEVFWEAAELAWDKIQSFDPAKGGFTNWFCWRIRQVIRKRERKHKACPEVSMDELAARNIEPAVEGPSARHEAAELARRVQEALDSLPERIRLPFVLHVYDGLSLAEVGLRLGRCKDTVRSQVDRAKELLAERLGPGWESYWFGTDWCDTGDDPDSLDNAA